MVAEAGDRGLATYFTVDGHGRFSPGAVVGLEPVDVGEAPEDLAEGAREFLGAGVSSHGQVALLSAHMHPAHVDDARLEVLLEVTRRDVAPGAVPRLQALFAFCAVTDAEAFRDSHRGADDAIYSVQGPDDAFRGDARLLGIAGSPLVGAIYARWYWQGRPNPLGPPLWEVLLGLPVTIGERVG